MKKELKSKVYLNWVEKKTSGENTSGAPGHTSGEYTSGAPGHISGE